MSGFWGFLEFLFKEQDDISPLQEKLNTLPPSMVIFSQNLRALYNEVQVTGQDKETKTFLEVRDSVRQNGIVYVNSVLPMTEEVIRAIGFFADYFTDLDFEDWSECLEDIISDIEKAKGICDILKQFHSSIIQDLMKNQDKAQVSITALTKMKERYKQEEIVMNEMAQTHMADAAEKRDWGWGAVFTLGISTFFTNKWADEADAKAVYMHLEATGKKENSDIAQQAVMLVEGQLIPSVKKFISGLEVCSEFLSNSKEKLEKMKLAGDKGVKKPYYTMMKNRAGELNETCLKFLAVTDLMRNHMAAIPTKPDDKNYVDKWLVEQKNQFAQEHPSIWKKIDSQVSKISSMVGHGGGGGHGGGHDGGGHDGGGHDNPSIWKKIDSQVSKISSMVKW